MKKQLTCRHTTFACFIGCIVQAILSNFTPLFFLTFQSSCRIPLTQITMPVTVNFGVQLPAGLLSAGFVDKIGYAPRWASPTLSRRSALRCSAGKSGVPVRRSENTLSKSAPLFGSANRPFSRIFSPVLTRQARHAMIKAKEKASITDGKRLGRG